MSFYVAWIELGLISISLLNLNSVNGPFYCSVAYGLVGHNVYLLESAGCLQNKFPFSGFRFADVL
jgi:hypothetical protein